MPSYARVTNLHNGRSIVVRVNDRGPYHHDRIIDLSSKTAELLALRRSGTGKVRVEYVGPASLAGSNDRKLIATLREGRPAPAPAMMQVAAARSAPPRFEPVQARSRAIAAPPPSREADAPRAMASRTIESELLRDESALAARGQTRSGTAGYGPAAPAANGLGRGLY
jgi:rare lipoprotein A